MSVWNDVHKVLTYPVRSSDHSTPTIAQIPPKRVGHDPLQNTHSTPQSDGTHSTMQPKDVFSGNPQVKEGSFDSSSLTSRESPERGKSGKWWQPWSWGRGTNSNSSHTKESGPSQKKARVDSQRTHSSTGGQQDPFLQHDGPQEQFIPPGHQQEQFIPPGQTLPGGRTHGDAHFDQVRTGYVKTRLYAPLSYTYDR